ncbi:MAG: DUF192 domain-containing protein [Vicinamibacterales bacterium]|jgi:hypothetical protein|nr:hypothetical protein [Acidobacteriota bacterium]MDP6373589.1 DUF192 domain-containing protein [Vicinamibacterales bacterium]MDP6609119.1 DUF192 domain-containing protein [Vicinamibacterales bacterium]HAK54468.1 hypothetical protein [Acidobacteriota bacterium]|tara:strand:- start:5253 stop:5702 length:450 start_codon:yes stop_codon:yes gene_type:complete
MLRVGFALALLVACSGPSPAEQAAGSSGAVVFPDDTRVRVEIADTAATRERGLMFRESMAENEGMIFVFDASGFYPFWMKDTLIPLDMLWVDAGGRVVSIANSVPPCRADPCPTYSPEADALYVVEVVSGFAKTHGVEVGDALTLVGLP